MLPSDVIDAGATLSFVVTALSILKPLIERIPGVGAEGDVHDSVMRILNFAMSLGGLILVARLNSGQWPPSSQYLSIIAAAAGSAVGAHVVYQVAKGSTAAARAAKMQQQGIAYGGVAQLLPPPTAAPEPEPAFVSAPVPAPANAPVAS